VYLDESFFISKVLIFLQFFSQFSSILILFNVQRFTKDVGKPFKMFAFVYITIRSDDPFPRPVFVCLFAAYWEFYIRVLSNAPAREVCLLSMNSWSRHAQEAEWTIGRLFFHSIDLLQGGLMGTC
jgi:hypothetical protein